MQFRLTISTENSAFDDYPGGEISKSLRDLASEIEATSSIGLGWTSHILDVNGNVVGQAEFVAD